MKTIYILLLLLILLVIYLMPTNAIKSNSTPKEIVFKFWENGNNNFISIVHTEDYYDKNKIEAIKELLKSTKLIRYPFPRDDRLLVTKGIEIYYINDVEEINIEYINNDKLYFYDFKSHYIALNGEEIIEELMKIYYQ